jgi:hypothetical protein
MVASAKLRVRNIRRRKPRPLAPAKRPETREEIDYLIRTLEKHDVAKQSPSRYIRSSFFALIGRNRVSYDQSATKSILHACTHNNLDIVLTNYSSTDLYPRLSSSYSSPRLFFPQPTKSSFLLRWSSSLPLPLSPAPSGSSRRVHLRSSAWYSSEDAHTKAVSFLFMPLTLSHKLLICWTSI